MNKELKKALFNIKSELEEAFGCEEFNENVIDDYNLIVKALTPPTADEVCKALSEELYRTIQYKNGDFMNDEYYVIAVDGEMITINFTLSLNLITMISRFYEGEE